MVQESVADAETVQKHFAKYGLKTEEPKSLDGGQFLGIASKRKRWRDLQMLKATTLSEVAFESLRLTKRPVFLVW